MRQIIKNNQYEPSLLITSIEVNRFESIWIEKVKWRIEEVKNQLLSFQKDSIIPIFSEG